MIIRNGVSLANSTLGVASSESGGVIVLPTTTIPKFAMVMHLFVLVLVLMLLVQLEVGVAAAFESPVCLRVESGKLYRTYCTNSKFDFKHLKILRRTLYVHSNWRASLRGKSTRHQLAPQPPTAQTNTSHNHHDHGRHRHRHRIRAPSLPRRRRAL